MADVESQTDPLEEAKKQKAETEDKLLNHFENLPDDDIDQAVEGAELLDLVQKRLKRGIEESGDALYQDWQERTWEELGHNLSELELNEDEIRRNIESVEDIYISNLTTWLFSDLKRWKRLGHNISELKINENIKKRLEDNIINGFTEDHRYHEVESSIELWELLEYPIEELALNESHFSFLEERIYNEINKESENNKEELTREFGGSTVSFPSSEIAVWKKLGKDVRELPIVQSQLIEMMERGVKMEDTTTIRVVARVLVELGYGKDSEDFKNKIAESIKSDIENGYFQMALDGIEIWEMLEINVQELGIDEEQLKDSFLKVVSEGRIPIEYALRFMKKVLRDKLYKDPFWQLQLLSGERRQEAITSIIAKGRAKREIDSAVSRFTKATKLMDQIISGKLTQ